MNEAPILNVQNLCFSYPCGEILSNISFQLQAASKTAIIGPSGSGKTSLLRLIAGLEKAKSGSIEILDRKEPKKSVAMMTQKDCLLEHLSLIDNLELPLKIANEKIDREKSLEMVKILGLEKFMRAKPAELSGGMRQRLSFASCLIQKKPLILLDEPFSGLDYLNKEKVCAMINQVLCQSSFLVVTHDQWIAKELCDDVLHLERGKLHSENLYELYRNNIKNEFSA